MLMFLIIDKRYLSTIECPCRLSGINRLSFAEKAHKITRRFAS